jgi:hypothetical protein
MDRLHSVLNRFGMLMLFVLTVFVGGYALADSPVVAPQDFFAQALDTIQHFGGLPWMGKVSAAILLLVASMKVSFLNQLLWSKLGSLQAWLAPLLGLLAGILGLGSGGAAVTGASIFAYVVAGGGAVILHELLDSVKAIPGIGQIYVSIIGVIESLLGAPKAQ